MCVRVRVRACVCVCARVRVLFARASAGGGMGCVVVGVSVGVADRSQLAATIPHTVRECLPAPGAIGVIADTSPKGVKLNQ